MSGGWHVAPDAGMPIEHVMDREGYVWRVVRDGGMATRAHYAGLVSIGIAALERTAGPLRPVVDLAGAREQIARVVFAWHSPARFWDTHEGAREHALGLADELLAALGAPEEGRRMSEVRAQ